MFEICGIGPLYVRAAITRPCNNNYSQLDPLSGTAVDSFYCVNSIGDSRGDARVGRPWSHARRRHSRTPGWHSAAVPARPRHAPERPGTVAGRRSRPPFTRRSRGWRGRGGRPRLGWPLAGLPGGEVALAARRTERGRPGNRKGRYSRVFVSLHWPVFAIVCVRVHVRLCVQFAYKKICRRSTKHECKCL